MVYEELYYRGLLDSSSSSSGDWDPSFGYLQLTFTIGSFSLTKLSDDNPIDMLDFIANIGGFWGERTSASNSTITTRRKIILTGATVVATATRCYGICGRGSLLYSHPFFAQTFFKYCLQGRLIFPRSPPFLYRF